MTDHEILYESLSAEEKEKNDILTKLIEEYDFGGTVTPDTALLVHRLALKRLGVRGKGFFAANEALIIAAQQLIAERQQEE